MPVHDDWARITPAELSFPDAGTAADRFRAIAEEAEAREVDPADPSAFVMLMESGRALRELRGPGDDPGRVREHGVLLYHLFHSWRAGDPVFLLDRRVVRLVVESGPWETGEVGPAGSAGYVQLPRHLVWVRADAKGEAPGEEEGGAGGTPESVDGLFWTLWEGRVSFLLVMGIRPDRPGFGVVPLDPVPLLRANEWIDAPMREEGEDFATSMPGAELDRLYEVRTAGEVLKLGTRVLRYLATAPEEARTAVDGPPDPAPATSEEASGPRPSSRPYVRVRLAP